MTIKANFPPLSPISIAASSSDAICSATAITLPAAATDPVPLAIVTTDIGACQFILSASSEDLHYHEVPPPRIDVISYVLALSVNSGPVNGETSVSVTGV